mmetsp:Transcript_14162/g.60606  ORF Transcript_14162/g.60606 Transcript_14162/m.60606 type:complete len:415 (+) Transcript_14162:38-1282(+)
MRHKAVYVCGGVSRVSPTSPLAPSKSQVDSRCIVARARRARPRPFSRPRVRESEKKSLSKEPAAVAAAVGRAAHELAHRRSVHDVHERGLPGRRRDVVVAVALVLRRLAHDLRAGREREAVLVRGDDDGVILLEDAAQELVGHHLDQLRLDGALHRARAVRGVEALAREVVDGARFELQLHALAGDALGELVALQLHNLHDLRVRQRLEDDELVEAVDELGAEVRAHVPHHLLLDALAPPAPARLVPERDLVRAEVAGHDDQAVAEGNRAALRVRAVPLVQNLQEHVEDVDVRLFNLVKEHDGVRLLAHGVREHAALVVADVSGGGADQPRHGVLLHVLGHVQADQRGVRVEQVVGQRLGELRLTHAGGAEEHEGRHRAVGVGEVRARALHRLRDGRHGGLLPDHARVQLRLEL